MNLKPTIDEDAKSRILDELNGMKNAISWNYQGTATTVKEAIAEIKDGKDIGWQQTWRLMPTSACYHDWMDFAFLLTLIYNRDNEPKRFTILRTVIGNV